MNSAIETLIPANVSYSSDTSIEHPGSDQSPRILYNSCERRLDIVGPSTLEEAEAFFRPIVDQVYDDLHEKRSATVAFELTIFGHKTTKVLFKFFDNLKYFKQRNRVARIIWKYQSEDDNMRELGEAFSELFDLDFQLEAVA
ncbi:SiaC family regulatory phosphoprotein [Marinoscillum sp.]|uniref:SiaC family regulatory phosphoprotein n=1 Tax=Marinoscillum sp. TaxID=2024838 RepID=UPI003BAC5631